MSYRLTNIFYNQYNDQQIDKANDDDGKKVPNMWSGKHTQNHSLHEFGPFSYLRIVIEKTDQW